MDDNKTINELKSKLVQDNTNRSVWYTIGWENCASNYHTTGKKNESALRRSIIIQDDIDNSPLTIPDVNRTHLGQRDWLYHRQNKCVIHWLQLFLESVTIL